MKQKRALITGGAGFIGSYVNRLLAQQGWETFLVDNLSTGKKEAVQDGKLFTFDLRDKKQLDAVFEEAKPEAVFHFAAKIDVGESVHLPLDYYDNNVLGSLALLEAVKKYQTPHFIFSSTAAVYGIPETPLIKENHPKKPINPYGRSKLFVEEMLEDCKNAFGLSYIALRYFNAAGGDPEGIIKVKKDKEINLIPLVMKNLMAGKREMVIFGDDYPTKDGTCVRDYIHVADLAQAHILAWKYLKNGGASGCYNLGNGKGFSVREVGDAIAKATGISFDMRIGPRRAGDPPFLVADSQKARSDLVWQPHYDDLDVICRHAWQMLR